jgi:hypothetical protein
MRPRRAVVVAVLCLAAACGRGSLAGPGPTPSSPVASAPAATLTATPEGTTTPAVEPTLSPGPTLTGGRTLTETDAGKTVVLAVGQSVDVSLGAEYRPPASSSDAVTRTASTGGYPSGRPVRATFRADKAGKADVSSYTDYACLHSVPSCALPQQLWVVHITVS